VPDFAFATCLPGLEPAVKLEVGRVDTLRFAYSRPGLVTFKSSGPVTPDDRSPTAFARVWGRSLGPAREASEAVNQLGGLGVGRVHVFARDPDVEGELVPGPSPWLEPWRAAIQAALGVPGGPAEAGELVGDVIVAPDEPAWLGLHRADAYHLPHPGGVIPVEIPPDAPSRAYAKIEEAIAWAGLPVSAGQVALEIGCAPGGALLALARRGLEVWGVDSAELAPQVAALPAVHHLQLKVGALRWEQLPPRIDWLLVDVNLAPQVALHEVARLMPRLRRTLRGAVFTLKLNELAFVEELPELARRIAAMGFSDVRMRHLPSNRREIAVVARR
jgi:23S rRNA (cytidine2498-2'-O)-methyltransferase